MEKKMCELNYQNLPHSWSPTDGALCQQSGRKQTALSRRKAPKLAI